MGGLLVDAELTARLATAGEEELTATFTRLKPQFSALLTHNQVAAHFLPVSSRIDPKFHREEILVVEGMPIKAPLKIF